MRQEEVNVDKRVGKNPKWYYRYVQLKKAIRNGIGTLASRDEFGVYEDSSEGNVRFKDFERAPVEWE